MAGSNINRISVFAWRTIKCALVHITRPLESHSILAFKCSIYDIDSRCLLRVIAGSQGVETENQCSAIQCGLHISLHFRCILWLMQLQSDIKQMYCVLLKIVQLLDDKAHDVPIHIFD